MARFHIIADITLSSGTESFNSKSLALFHLGLVAALNNRHCLAAVDGVVPNAVSVEVANALDGQHLTLDLDLVALHDFLDRGTNVAHAHVNTSFLDASVRSSFAGLDK